MGNLRKTLSIIVAVVLLRGASAPFLVSMSTTFAQDTGTGHLAPLNHGFLDFLDQTPEAFYGYVPRTMDLSHLKQIPTQREQSQLTLPATWDWRDQGKVTPVKNQSSCYTCWAFATTSVLESAVLLGENAEYDFSEQSVVLHADRSWVYLFDESDDP